MQNEDAGHSMWNGHCFGCWNDAEELSQKWPLWKMSVCRDCLPPYVSEISIVVDFIGVQDFTVKNTLLYASHAEQSSFVVLRRTMAHKSALP